MERTGKRYELLSMGEPVLCLPCCEVQVGEVLSPKRRMLTSQSRRHTQ